MGSLGLAGIQRVFWDLDGTIVDTEPLHYEAFRRTFLPHELSPADYQRFFYGTTDTEGFIAMCAALGHPTADTWRGLIETKQRSFLELLTSDVPSLPGVPDLLRAIGDRGLPQCVLTSSDARTADLLLRSAGVRDWFDAVISAEEVGSKRNEATYMTVMARFSLTSGACLLLDDSERVRSAAARAGWRTHATVGADWARDLAA